MKHEVFIKPVGYENLMNGNQLFCYAGALQNAFAADDEVFEYSADLTDCLKEFFVIVHGLVSNMEEVYQRKNRYILKPVVHHLFQLKKAIYDHIDAIICNTEGFEKYDGDCYFLEFVRKGILTPEEADLMECLGNQSFQTLAEAIESRDYYISLDYADGIPDIYFSVMENIHTNMDRSPLLMLDSPYEIIAGVINLAYWAVDELFRVNKVTEICAKIITESAEVQPSLMAGNFEAGPLVHVFEKLVTLS